MNVITRRQQVIDFYEHRYLEGCKDQAQFGYERERDAYAAGFLHAILGWLVVLGIVALW